VALFAAEQTWQWEPSSERKIIINSPPLIGAGEANSDVQTLFPFYAWQIGTVLTINLG
jgi:hypothetical protein